MSGLSSRSYISYPGSLWCIIQHKGRDRACVRSVLTYETETWAKKAENLHSLEKVERIMVNVWSVLKNRKQSEVLYSGEAWQIEMVWASGM